jgi:probable rRNA maturation factor
MGIDVLVSNEQDRHVLDEHRWAELARAALVAEGVGPNAELSLLFVDEKAIAELNERYLGHEGPTDVLSFAIDDGDGGPGAELLRLVGDIVICPSVAATNAVLNGHSLDDEIALLVVHGVLHLLGMDHEDDVEAEMMERREQELLDAHFRQR